MRSMVMKDVNGNSIASHEAYQRLLVRQAETLMNFEKVVQSFWNEEVEIVSLRIILPVGEGEEYRVVLKARSKGEAFVAFHNGATFSEALVGLVNRLQNRSLKFKEDQYA
jgi:hypothetical protein